MSGGPSPGVLPPIAAYDMFAPAYRSYSETRKAYLQKVEEIVIGRLGGAASLLDVGAGDGSRALRIARAAGVKRLVLLEPSAGMRALSPRDVEIWPCGILEAPAPDSAFDAITCLWNVLGHLSSGDERVRALARMRGLLKPGGVVFLDVSHRYNGAAYGWARTSLRMARDLLSPSEKHGDATISWKAGEKTIRTQGHFFTHGEITGLCRSAGLKIVRRWRVNYETGELCRFSLCGHLLYQLTVA